MNLVRMRRYLPGITAAVFIAALLGGVIWVAQEMLSGDAKNPKKMVQQISLIQPPPPPPPPKLEEPPPPPEVKEEIKLDEPPPAPELDEANAEPPGEDLGLDAEGVAGGDGFGLRANKGGRGLIGGDGSRFGWYAKIVQTHIYDALAEDERLRKTGYAATVKIWLNAAGAVQRFEIADHAGIAEIDQALREALAGLQTLAEAPPQDMPQPIKLRIAARL